MVDGHEQKVAGTLEPGLVDTNHGVVVAVEQGAEARAVSPAAGHDAELARGHGEVGLDPVPIDDEVAGSAFCECRQDPHAADLPGIRFLPASNEPTACSTSTQAMNDVATVDRSVLDSSSRFSAAAGVPPGQ